MLKGIKYLFYLGLFFFAYDEYKEITSQYSLNDLATLSVLEKITANTGNQNLVVNADVKPYKTLVFASRFEDILEFNAVKREYRIITSDTLTVDYEDENHQRYWKIFAYKTNIPIYDWIDGSYIRAKKILAFISYNVVVKVGWNKPQFLIKDSADHLFITMPSAKLNDVYITNCTDINEQIYKDKQIDTSLLISISQGKTEAKQSANFDSKHLSSEFIFKMNNLALEKARELAKEDTSDLFFKANENLAKFFGDYYLKANYHIDHIVWKDENGKMILTVDRRASNE